MYTSKLETILLKRFLNFGFLLCGGPTKISVKVQFFYHFFALSCIFFLIVGNFVTVVNLSSNLYKIEACTMLLVGSAVIMIYLHFWIYRNQIAMFYSKCDENSPHYMGHDELEITAKMYFQTLKQQLACYVGTVIMCPMIAGIFLKDPKEIDSYEFTYFYSCGSRTESSSIKYCFERESFGNFILNDVLGNVFIAYRAFIIQVAQLIICCVIQSAEARLRVYDDLLTECIAKVKKMGKFDRNDLFEFEKIIKYQRTFHSYNRELKQITEMGIIMHMIGVFVILLVTILAVGSQKFTSLYMNVRWLTTACYVLFLHYEFCRSFVKCGYAQEHFTIALLEFPWYERHVRFQKCYLMTLTLCQKDDPYTVWGLYEVNLKLFAANVNRLYSVVNLVLLKYK
ncbi:uncharacterized protein LOC135848888 isoform X1 [Planococcus citri]|uniref:uncharacterized protein LOC135848888 isoform X1 n=1 Tax=Planococcus citri TaxID=170843 RepID=UPI0031F96577